MATGFIYVVTTATDNYEQEKFFHVPTPFGDRICFGPCKEAMRPRISPGDYFFGVSPSKPKPRRILFAAQVEEAISFARAYVRFPELHGPPGPIHVRRIPGIGTFPDSCYEHIPTSNHADRWERDLTPRGRDRFLVSHRARGWIGRWLGPNGPEIDHDILIFSTIALHMVRARSSE